MNVEPESRAIQGRKIVLVAVAWLLALSPALWSGDPLTFLDSDNYYISGGEAIDSLRVAAGEWLGIPVTAAEREAESNQNFGIRSLPYSIFLNATVRMFGLFAPIVITAGFTVWLIMLFTQPLAQRGLWQRQAIVVLAVTGGTTLPFYTAQIMPDILAAWLILIPMILVLRTDLERWQKIILYAMMGWAIVTHYAHIPLGFAMLVSLAAVFVWRKAWLPVAMCATVFVASMAVNVAISVLAPSSPSSGPSVAPSRFPIMLARSLEDGPARKYLEEVCPDPRYTLCEIYNEFPKNVGAALWDEDSIYNKATPQQARQIVAEEMDVLWGAFKAYPLEQIQALAGNAWQQLFMVNLNNVIIPDITVTGPSSIVIENTGLGYTPIKLAEALQLVSIMVAIAGLLLFWRKLSLAYRLAAALMLIGLIVNAVVCGGLSAPAHRYQGRIIWTLVLMGYMALAAYLPVSMLERRLPWLGAGLERS